jgi:hypothetical protein
MTSLRMLQPSWHRDSEAGLVCALSYGKPSATIATFGQENPMS